MPRYFAESEVDRVEVERFRNLAADRTEVICGVAAAVQERADCDPALHRCAMYYRLGKDIKSID